MTSILDQWAAHRKACHMETESEILGDKLAEEVKRLNRNIDKAIEAIERADLQEAYAAGHRIHFDDLQEFFLDVACNAMTK